MSDSKYRYYEVVVTKVVRANNQADALAVANNKRGVDAKVVNTEVEAFRITAGEAKSLATA